MSPETLLRTLRTPGTVLLDAPRPDADTGRPGALVFAAPLNVLEARTPADVPALLDRVDAALAAGRHVAGYLTYEAGYGLDARHPTVPTDPTLPLVWFGVYRAPASVTVSEVQAAMGCVPSPKVRDVAFALDPAGYRRRIETVKGHIREGDVYQINLTAPFRFRLEGDPLGLFAAMRVRQPVAYGAYLALPDATVVSVSPELFFRIRPGEPRTITARPMKGTAPRGLTEADDRRLGEALRASAKDRAENLMIVDLLRNDLARVAETGTVRVPSLFDAERYATVTQLTSTVRADLREGVTLGETLGALFPCGSVTGAPKLRAMEIIRDLEGGPRGVYCGAIGHAGPDGTSVFNVAIRTAVVADGAGRYDVGSGVVWDSEADAEYAECLLKARVLTDLAG